MGVERARYYPEIVVFGQLDRTSSNVVPGALFGVSNLPVVAGTPGRAFDLGTWTTAVGITGSWDVLGPRRWDPSIERARAELAATRADGATNQLDLAANAADRFITALEREETIRVAQAGVDRAQVFVTVVQASVGQDLRAGADLSRAKAEAAFASTALIRAQTAYEISLRELAEALGAPDAVLEPVAGALASLPPQAKAAPASSSDPRLLASRERTRAARQREQADRATSLPRLSLVGAIWLRGNGDLPGGAGAHGLVPDAPNWALGAAVTWPLFAGRTTDPLVRADLAEVARSQAVEVAIAQHRTSRVAQADAIVFGAYRITEVTPLALTAAREGQTQALARYRAQLATADDVAQTERLLEQAEVEEAIARLEVWRALLARAYSGGDLGPFAALAGGR